MKYEMIEVQAVTRNRFTGLAEPGDTLVIDQDIPRKDAERWVEMNIATPIISQENRVRATDEGDVTTLPDDIPAKELLEEAGIDSVEMLKQVSPEFILQVEGIGQKTLDKIVHYLNNRETDPENTE